MSYFHLVIATPFIFALLVPVLYKKINPRIHTGWFVLIIPLVLFIYFLSYSFDIYEKGAIYLTLPWIPSYDINLTFTIDGLSLIFSLLITGIGILVVLYSIYYMSKLKEALHNFYVYILLFMGSMLGLVFSDNIFVLYVFWEITSISSFLLIAYWFEREKSRSGALKSMLITIFGGFAMLAGFILTSMISDTYSIQEMISKIDIIQSHSLFVPAMVLVLIGAFTKSAQFPFSIWLPDAMEAPTPISAYLHSATMVKAGIYLVARFTNVFGGVSEWFWLVTGVGIVTLLYGSINAVKQTDLKALLAYSTISQLGLIMSLLGLGSAALYFNVGNEGNLYAIAIFAALFHMVNHSTFKGSLFMVVGIIDHEIGTRDIRRLGGLIYVMPVSFSLAFIGSFAMAGLPPFNGFLSKELFFTSVLQAAEIPFFRMGTWGFILVIAAWVASVFTFVYCMIIVFKTFFGEQKSDKLKKKAHEAPVGMLIPPLVLAGLVIAIFFYPDVLSKYFLHSAWVSVLPSIVEDSELLIEISQWHGINREIIMTLGVVIIGIILYKTVKKWSKVYNYYPEVLTLNSIYESAIEKLEDLSLSITKRYMTGFVRDYLIYILGFIILIVGGSVILLDGISFNMSRNSEAGFFELGLLIGIVITAFAVAFAKTRMASIITIGGLGFLIVFIFVLFRAPDLALTQLVVETITTVLFLLCFYHLPKYKKEQASIGFKVTNGIIAVGIGLVMTLVALSAYGNGLFEPISYFYKNSYELAGAKNIVNAILVDFRGFDTMLEILVLSMGGLGVYTLIKLRLSRRKENEETK
ncbi:MAG: Na+/H+ antiporter subunit A [Anaerovoracaceae bacterium]|jgi:multicomponent Na+:H+ antiporter subunit A|nr:Na+/H+ antiporter subunit A [Clostridiales bacterium]